MLGLFIIQFIYSGFLNLIVWVINMIVDVLNAISFSFDIPMPDPFDDIEITFSLPDFGHMSYLTFPSLGTIPWKSIDDVRILPDKILIIWLLKEVIGFSLP